MSINDPRDIPGLVVWYSADYEATQYADAAELTVLHDLSGNGNDTDAVAAGVASRPVMDYNDGPSGGPSLNTVATGRGWSMPNIFDIGGGSPATAIETYCTINALGDTRGPFHTGTYNSGVGEQYYPFSDGNIYSDFGIQNRPGFAPGVAITNTWRRINVWSAPADFDFRIDDVSRHANSGYTVGINADPWVGNYINNGGNPAGTRFGVILFFNRKLTTGERTDLIAWVIANPSGGLQFTPGPPDEPVDLDVVEHVLVGDFSWDPAGTGDPATGFEVRLDAGAGFDNGLDDDYQFTGLDPDTTYTASVRAYNDDGFSDWVDFEFTTLAIPESDYTATIVIGDHSWTIAHDDVIDPDDPIHVLDQLRIGWQLDESKPWPTQPAPVQALVRLLTTDVDELDDVTVGTPMSIVLVDDDDNLLATFHGRVSQDTATPLRRPSGLYMLYQVSGVDYTVDPAETPLALADPLPAADADDRFAVIVALAAAAGLAPITAPTDVDSAAFAEYRAATTNAAALLGSHLEQIAVDVGDGLQRPILVPVVVDDVLDHYETPLLARVVDASLLPATFAVEDGLLVLVFPDIFAEGVVDAHKTLLDTVWNRLKYRAANRVIVATDDFIVEASRPGPPVKLELTSTLTDEPAARRMAELYLPDVDETNGWVADPFTLLAYIDQSQIIPTWFPDHRADPAATTVYVQPIAVVGVAGNINLAGNQAYAGQLSQAQLTIAKGRIVVTFALRRQLPVGVGDDAASWAWAQTEFPTVAWEDIDPGLSWYEARLGKAT